MTKVDEINLKKKYVPDIDGLRAVAIISVLLYHVGYSWVPGGFVGVDVFFVISGYLITKIILSDIGSQKFTYTSFFIRRSRRLLPALLVILILSSIVAYNLFSPADLERFGQSLLYANVSLSNFFFMFEAGYFDAVSETKPLLHTWSLAVEEQFYLIWPFLLVLLSSFGKKQLIMLFLVLSAVTSVVFSSINSDNNVALSFFMLPFRVFEFSIGALVLWVEHFDLRKKYTYEILALIGLAMIVSSVMLFSKTMAFPGYIALIPTIGTALVIFASNKSKIGGILRGKVLVSVGLVSYSLYLVHWPIIVFYKYWVFEEISSIDKILLIVSSFFTAFILWKFVERPFRLKKDEEPRSYYNVIIVFILLAISIFAANLWANKGYSSHYPEIFQMSMDDILEERDRYWSKFGRAGDNILRGDSSQGKVLFMSNSYGIDLVYALRQNGFMPNIVYLPTSHRCSNFGTLPNGPEHEGYCQGVKKRNLSNDKFGEIDRVYLHDNWRVLNLEHLKRVLIELRNITNAPIYVFGPKMDFTKNVPDIVKRYMNMGGINEYSQKFQNTSRREYNALLKMFFVDEFFTTNKIFYVDMLASQCGDDIKECEIVTEQSKDFLYFDQGHFTKKGSHHFGNKLKIKYPEVFQVK